MLANLPTNTAVSRSAFFAGKPMAAGEMHSPSADPERWIENAEVRKLFPGTDGPRLLLRGESDIGDGSATEEALSLVAHRERRAKAPLDRAARTTRRFRLLRAHGIIRKPPKTQRYVLTRRGRLLTAHTLRLARRR